MTLTRCTRAAHFGKRRGIRWSRPEACDAAQRRTQKTRRERRHMQNVCDATPAACHFRRHHAPEMPPAKIDARSTTPRVGSQAPELEMFGLMLRCSAAFDASAGVFNMPPVRVAAVAAGKRVLRVVERPYGSTSRYALIRYESDARRFLLSADHISTRKMST